MGHPLNFNVEITDRTKGKAYLTLVGPHVHIGDFPQIKGRYSAKSGVNLHVLIKEV